VPPRRTSRSTSMPFAIMGLLVVAAAAYYGYRNGTFASATACLNSTPSNQALERRTSRGKIATRSRKRAKRQPHPTPAAIARHRPRRRGQPHSAVTGGRLPSAAPRTPSEGATQSPSDSVGALPAQSPYRRRHAAPPAPVRTQSAIVRRSAARARR
jgi:hypothetical protein